MKLVAFWPQRKYGSAIFVKPNTQVKSSKITEINDVEVLTWNLEKYTATSVHKPTSSIFEFNEPRNFNNHETKIMIGDFNCHS